MRLWFRKSALGWVKSEMVASDFVERHCAKPLLVLGQIS
jgi:hypothetical protein